MTARAIAERLGSSSKGITPDRIRKAQVLAARYSILWAEVLVKLTPAQRAQVK
jgi:hypothetical protein